MERINLSDLKAVSRYIFIDNIFSKVEEKLQGKELEFYSLNGEDMKTLSEGKKDGSDLEFIYKIIPMISNVNVDVDFKDFEKMSKYPSLAFASYYKSLINEVGNLFKTVNQINELDRDVKNTAKDLGLEEVKEIENVEEVKEIIIEKTTEEKIDDLYAELETVKDDKVKRREVMKQISILEDSVVSE